MRAVAGAEPAVVVALVRERDAAEMGADADQHEPLVVALLDARLVGRRVRQARHIDRARLVDLFLGAMVDEDRLAAPEHLDHLALGDRRQIDLDRRAGRDRGGIRVHLRDQRHQRGRSRRPPLQRRSRYRENRDVSARPKTSLSRCRSLSVAFGPPRSRFATARATRGSPLAEQSPPWRRADRPLPPAPGRRDGATWRSIGTLAEGVQVRHRHNGRKSHKSLPYGRFSAAGDQPSWLLRKPFRMCGTFSAARFAGGHTTQHRKCEG